MHRDWHQEFSYASFHSTKTSENKSKPFIHLNSHGSFHTRFLTCTTALVPITSRTCPLLLVPSGSVRWTISAYLGNWFKQTTVWGAGVGEWTNPFFLQRGHPHLHVVQDHQRSVHTRHGGIGWNTRQKQSFMIKKRVFNRNVWALLFKLNII